MARRSKIDQLPEQIRERIGELFMAGRTLDEILGKLAELGVEDISRSGLHRHTQKLEAVAERMRNTRMMADVLSSRLESEADNKLVRLNAELLQTAIFDLMSGAETGEAVQLDPEALMMLNRALQANVSAMKTDSEMRAKIRAQVAKEMAEQLEQEAKTNKGLTAETVAALKQRFLGMRQGA